MARNGRVEKGAGRATARGGADRRGQGRAGSHAVAGRSASKQAIAAAANSHRREFVIQCGLVVFMIIAILFGGLQIGAGDLALERAAAALEKSNAIMVGVENGQVPPQGVPQGQMLAPLPPLVSQ